MVCAGVPQLVGGRDETGALFSRRVGPGLARAQGQGGNFRATVQCVSWSQRDYANISRKASWRRWPLAQIAMRGLWKGGSQEGGAA